MTRTTRILAALALLLSGVGQATAGPVSSSLSLQADSNAGAGTVTDTDSQSQGATINTLSASVLALAVNGNASVQTSATGLATWTNPNVGQVVLSDVGWTAVNVGVGSAFLTSGLDYSYTFTADATGTFLLNYDITATGSDTFGLNGFNYDFSGNGAFFVVGTSGTITESVIAGNTYTLTLRNQANISGGLGTRDALMTGVFDFAAPAGVPEPASIALLGAGALGLAGYSWRKRRSAA